MIEKQKNGVKIFRKFFTPLLALILTDEGRSFAIKGTGMIKSKVTEVTSKMPVLD